MAEKKMTALEAHRAGKLALPPGYELEHDPDVLLLRRDDGSVAAVFSARGAIPAEVARTAEKDHRQHVVLDLHEPQQAKSFVDR